ncbi:protein import receptor MAS20 [Myriangium duriaei CBS 260.36]|uniref:Mitochondrial import receptor subunit TOM20 n=1 Tax=Myriangium duriaei CBS 260.36 TaxID=1168546 RepID=A0A9P4MGG7_9PEZI|nr:protein import receptor MAS20 [Myriangium duriaei CBS 260.36]
MASTQSSGPSTTTIVLATVGTFTALAIGYAAYFDHKRRTDPSFRKQLKKAAKQASKQEKASAVSAERERATQIRAAVDEANAEGFPTDPEKTETYFMQQVEQGEIMTADGSDPVGAALCFYRALKVYPQPRELINIYDKTVTKPILDILAEMIAIDSTIAMSSSTGSDAGSAHNVE